MSHKKSRKNYCLPYDKRVHRTEINSAGKDFVDWAICLNIVILIDWLLDWLADWLIRFINNIIRFIWFTDLCWLITITYLIKWFWIFRLICFKVNNILIYWLIYWLGSICCSCNILLWYLHDRFVWFPWHLRLKTLL